MNAKQARQKMLEIRRDDSLNKIAELKAFRYEIDRLVEKFKGHILMSIKQRVSKGFDITEYSYAHIDTNCRTAFYSSIESWLKELGYEVSRYDDTTIRIGW